MSDKHCRIHMRTGIANEITKEYWNNSGTIVQRIKIGDNHNGIKIKHENDGKLIKELKHHLGADNIILIENKHYPDYQLDKNGNPYLDEDKSSYWIYEIKCINWSYLDCGLNREKLAKIKRTCEHISTDNEWGRDGQECARRILEIINEV